MSLRDDSAYRPYTVHRCRFCPSAVAKRRIEEPQFLRLPRGPSHGLAREHVCIGPRDRSAGDDNRGQPAPGQAPARPAAVAGSRFHTLHPHCGISTGVAASREGFLRTLQCVVRRLPLSRTRPAVAVGLKCPKGKSGGLPTPPQRRFAEAPRENPNRAWRRDCSRNQARASSAPHRA